MTIEEALKVLERVEDYVGIHYINGVEDPYINPYLLKAIDFAVAALREQEERENLKPLTLEELRQTHNPVWCSCELLDGGNGFWCLCINGKIIAPSGDSFDVEEIPNWVFLRNKPKEDA